MSQTKMNIPFDRERETRGPHHDLQIRSVLLPYFVLGINQTFLKDIRHFRGGCTRRHVVIAERKEWRSVLQVCGMQ
jgi:hypothetical protein